METELEKVYLEYKKGLVLGLQGQVTKKLMDDKMEKGSVLAASALIFSKYSSPFSNIDEELLKVQTPSIEFLKLLNNHTDNCIGDMKYCESKIIEIYKELKERKFLYNQYYIYTKPNWQYSYRINIPYFYFVKNCLLSLSDQFHTDITSVEAKENSLSYIKKSK